MYLPLLSHPFVVLNSTYILFAFVWRNGQLAALHAVVSVGAGTGVGGQAHRYGQSNGTGKSIRTGKGTDTFTGIRI